MRILTRSFRAQAVKQSKCFQRTMLTGCLTSGILGIGHSLRMSLFEGHPVSKIKPFFADSMFDFAFLQLIVDGSRSTSAAVSCCA